MQQLIVEIQDAEKVQMLYQLLTSLDFVNSIKINNSLANVIETEEDFFSLAGVWKN